MTKILFFLVAAIALAQTQVPENLKPPPSETVLLKAVGKGRQIYSCGVKEEKFAWTLERPQADLFDARGNRIGRHYKGPTWEATDGSRVVGQLEQQATAPRPGAVAWLLLKAKSHTGAGVLSNVTYIQRLNTVGGAAPALRKKAATKGTPTRKSPSNIRPTTTSMAKSERCSHTAHS